MQAISNNLTSDQFETLTQKLSEIQNLISGKETKPQNCKSSCKPPCAPEVIDNSVQITENKKQYLFHSFKLEPNQKIIGYKDTEGAISSGIFKAFKPFELQIQAKNKKGIVKDIEILNVTVMGTPQLINYDGCSVIENRGTSLVFNKLRSFDIQTFGSTNGLGVQFSISNPYNEQLDVTIAIVGTEDKIENIGRGYLLLAGRLLFTHAICNKKENKKVIVTAGRMENLKISKLQIYVLDFDGNKIDINLIDINHRKSSQFVNATNVRIPSSFFEEPKEINLENFGKTENQALIFEFENPTEKDVRIYITLE